MGDPVKWTFAKQLAVSLGILVLQRDDRLSFSAVSDEKKPPFRRKGATYRKAFTQTISDLKEPVMTTFIFGKCNFFFTERQHGFICYFGLLGKLGILGKIASKATKICRGYSYFTSSNK